VNKEFPLPAGSWYLIFDTFFYYSRMFLKERFVQICVGMLNIIFKSEMFLRRPFKIKFRNANISWRPVARTAPAALR